MPDTVNVPGGGKANKKLVIYGAVALAGLLGFAYYRNHKSAGAATAASPAGLIDPATGVPYAQESGAGIDPNTGVPYAQESAYGQGIDPATGIPFSAEGGFGAFGNTGTGTNNPVSTSTAPNTNSAWAQQVESDLTSIGYSATDVASAVGRYLAKLSLTAAQQNIILIAIAENGPPPQGSFSVIPKPEPHPHPTHEVTANGHQDLRTIAVANGITEARLIELNPGLKHLEGSKKPVPAGTKVKV